MIVLDQGYQYGFPGKFCGSFICCSSIKRSKSYRQVIFLPHRVRRERANSVASKSGYVEDTTSISTMSSSAENSGMVTAKGAVRGGATSAVLSGVGAVEAGKARRRLRPRPDPRYL